DFAVFLFDFRGHGRSLDIKEDFWRNPFNRTGVKGWDVRKPRETIGFKDFHKEYNLNLVNDIAAAKAYLDSLNDQGKVNSANVVLIGAKEGATLGALWMRQEWSRYPLNGAFKPDMNNPCGRDIVCAIWLSISPRIGYSNVPLSLTLRFNKEKKVPMAFLYGDKDERGKTVADKVLNVLNPKKNGQRNPKLLIGAKKIDGAEKLDGRQPRGGSGTEISIASWLGDVMKTKKLNAYNNQNFRRNDYVWQFPLRVFITAKRKGDRSLVFTPPTKPFLP